MSEEIQPTVTFIEAVLRRPKMYTFYDGSFGAAISFLQGYYSGLGKGWIGGSMAAGSKRTEPRQNQEWFDFCHWLQWKTDSRFKTGALIFNAPYEDDALCFAELLELYSEFRRAPEEEQRGERI